MVSDTSPDKISNLLSKNLEQCNQWPIGKKLSLCMGKRELMLIGTKLKIKQYDDYSITSGVHTVTATKSVIHYLSLKIDNVLSGEQMSSDIIKEVLHPWNLFWKNLCIFLKK